MKVWKWTINIKRISDAPEYPKSFAMIDWSPVAKQTGIRDDENKLIYRFFINNENFREVKVYPYTQHLIKIIKDVHQIPIYDKTKKKEILPVFTKILPS